MPRVNWFEIPVDKPARAVTFYKKVFGWKVVKWKGPEDYWTATTGKKSEPGIDGAFTRRSSLPATTNTIMVPSVDRFVKKIVAAGGKVTAPKMTIPKVGYMAYCKDTEGNMFGILEADMKAK